MKKKALRVGSKAKAQMGASGRQLQCGSWLSPDAPHRRLWLPLRLRLRGSREAQGLSAGLLELNPSLAPPRLDLASFVKQG